MSDKIKYIYGEQFAQKLPGSPNNPLLPNQGNYYFRTATSYEVDGNGKPIEGTSRTNLYYAPKPAARTSDGKPWTPGTADSTDNFDQGGWVNGGYTNNNGKTYTFFNYTQEDADLGRIPPGKNVGDEVLGATARQSLTTSGGRFYEAVQNNLINLAVNTQPGLAKVVSAKQANAASSQEAADALAADAADVADAAANPSLENTLQLRTIKAVPLQNMDSVDIDNTRYPFDMKDMDAVLFTRKEYTPVDFNKETVRFSRDEKNTKTQGRVILGIQPSIRDTNTVSWQGLTLNMFETAAADFFYSAAGGGSSGINAFTERAEATLKQGGADLKSGILSLLGQEAVGTKGLTSRLTGAVFNPNLELLFQGPELRTFNFNFNLSPRKKEEADAIKRIIKFFKKGMAVQRTAAELFLKAPHVFDIEYQLNGTQIHPSLNKIKTCALTACTIDYTPTNSYMTFREDGTPVQYSLSLTFQELTPVYADDYDEDNHAIGY